MLFVKQSLIAAVACLVPAAAALSGYRTVNSSFSDYSLRYKSWDADDTTLCNGGSKHHTGWADLDNRHLFFWYHEARHDPDSAPLLIWHQGGPGGSSLHGMLFENGPCLSDGPNATKFNPHSWTEYFNVVYLDQPAGVGFSYDDNGTTGYPPALPVRTPASSLDSVAFIRLLYEAFPSLKKVDLHLSGESFAGRFVPNLASSILDYNAFFDPVSEESASEFIIPLRSILVGNPWINPAIQIPMMHEVSCSEWRGYQQHLDEDLCGPLEKSIRRCDLILRACEKGGPESLLCAMAQDACWPDFLDVFQSATRSVYDRRRRHCQAPGSCYPDATDPVYYLNQNEIFEDQLEVTSQTGGVKAKWDMFDAGTGQRYMSSGDFYELTTPTILKLLKHARSEKTRKFQQPFDILFYVGVTDIICNTDGVLGALRDVDWEDKASFRGTPWEELPWTSSSGSRAGRVKRVPNLWLAEIEEAGHMVPYDQPVASLKLVNNWLSHLKGRDGARNTLDQNDDQPDQSVFNDDRGVEL